MSDQSTEIAFRDEIFDEKTLIAFISEQIDKFKNHAKMVGDPNALNLTDLNRALAEYSIVEGALLSMQALTRIELRKHKENFEDWLSAKYIFIRNRENKPELAAQKWLGQKEIEKIIRVEFSLEFKNLKERKDMVEMRGDFIDRMLKAWGNHQFILNQLSKNLEIQVMIGNTKMSRNLE